MSDSASNKVLLRNENGEEWEINGESATNFGQHIFIDTKDVPQQIERRRLQDDETVPEIVEEGDPVGDDTESETVGEGEAVSEEGPQPKEANHQIIGATFVGEDQLDHVNFYKLVETIEGNFELFEFGMDVI